MLIAPETVCFTALDDSNIVSPKLEPEASALS
jgi:hypothetical protein